MNLVNRQAPDFQAKAVQGKDILEDFRLSKFNGKYVVLFFYPLDFTFVCPTELHAFQEKLPEFEKRSVQLVGVSTDSWFSHLAWLNTPKARGGSAGSPIRWCLILIKQSPVTMGCSLKRPESRCEACFSLTGKGLFSIRW